MDNSTLSREDFLRKFKNDLVVLQNDIEALTSSTDRSAASSSSQNSSPLQSSHSRSTPTRALSKDEVRKAVNDKFKIKKPLLVEGLVKRKRGNLDFFVKDVTLIPRKGISEVTKNYLSAIKKKKELKCDVISFSRSSTAAEIQNDIQESFKPLLDDVSFKLMRAEGNFLSEPRLKPGLTMHGGMVYLIFNNKKMYIVPDQNLDVHIEGFSEDEEEDIDTPITYINQRHTPKPSSSIRFEVPSLPKQHYTIDYDVSVLEPQVIFDCNDDDSKEVFSVDDGSDFFSQKFTSLDQCYSFLKNLLGEGKQRPLYVERESVLSSAGRGLLKSSFDPTKPLSVTFTDLLGKPEGAVDIGGVTLEFFTLAVKEMHRSCLFEGPESERFLTLEAQALGSNKYFIAGQIIALSIVHRGPGPNFFSEEFYEAILQNSLSNRAITREKVYDPIILEEIMKIENMSNIQDLQYHVNTSSFLSAVGIMQNVKSLNDKELLVMSILRFTLVQRLEEAFQQFLKGLSTLGVLQVVRANQSLFRKFFLPHEVPLTDEIVGDYFVPLRSDSVKEKERFVLENKVLSWWRYFLVDVQEGLIIKDLDNSEEVLKLEDVVLYATGLEREPPFGWVKKPRMAFLHNRPDCRVPKSSVCGSEISLPISNTSYEEFIKKMTFAISICSTMDDV